MPTRPPPSRFGAVEEAIGLSLQEPEEGETPTVDADDEDYETEEQRKSTTALSIPTRTASCCRSAKAKPGPVGRPDRERLERVLQDLVACRQLLDNALKDG